jgi:hypothetical protein
VAFRKKALREYAAARILDSLGLLSDGLVATVGASMELSPSSRATGDNTSVSVFPVPAESSASGAAVC